MSVNRSHSMDEDDPDLIFVAAANVLTHLDPGTQTREAMKCAGLNQVDIKYDTYRNSIGILKNKIVAYNSSQIAVRHGSILALHQSHILVRDGSTFYPSILKIHLTVTDF